MKLEEIKQGEIAFVEKLYGIMNGYEKRAKKVKAPYKETIVKNLSQMLDVSEPTLEKILNYLPEKVSFDTIRNIRDLREIFLILDESLHNEGIYEWLSGYNKYLEGKQPLELLLNKDYKQLKQAAVHLRDNISF
ncbi:hypothetical protein JW756_04700 [Candidatus Woesearchaeota archaeon]|nr:hypothetical protein [Candidatus Woesearchaeota archaeon]